MEVLLLKENEHLGDKGAVVNVSAGFARNYLFPSKLAEEVTPALKIHLVAIDKQRQKKVQRERDAKSQDIKKLESGTYVLKTKVSDHGKLFGTITHAQIAEVISKESGLAIDKRKINTEGAIKKVGEHAIVIKYFPGLEARVTIKIAAEEEKKS